MTILCPPPVPTTKEGIWHMDGNKRLEFPTKDFSLPSPQHCCQLFARFFGQNYNKKLFRYLKKIQSKYLTLKFVLAIYIVNRLKK